MLGEVNAGLSYCHLTHACRISSHGGERAECAGVTLFIQIQRETILSMRNTQMREEKLQKTSLRLGLVHLDCRCILMLYSCFLTFQRSQGYRCLHFMKNVMFAHAEAAAMKRVCFVVTKALLCDSLGGY